MLKVGFLGNCQAQALQSWIKQVSDKIAVVNFGPVWLLTDESLGQTLDAIEKCDFVFAQRLSDDFSLVPLRTKELKGTFGSKIVSWPNAYFDGYFPGVGYRYGPQGKVVGPLDDYHFTVIRDSFLAGRTASQCAKILSSEDILELHPNPIARSLQCLADREAGLDTQVSDYVASHLARKRLFYAMNHPVNDVLLEILHRLFGVIGARKYLEALGPFGYPLEKIILPIFPGIASACRLSIPGETKLKGVKIEFSSGTFVKTDVSIWYDFEGLVDCFFRCYDTEEARSTSLRTAT